MRSKKEPVFLVGPTGVGKTSIAVWLAKRINAEIVSADSMQVYRGMEVGVAKPTDKERKEVPHHLIDIVTIDEEFSVAQYKELAEKTIREIQCRKKTPLIVGGTGLYIKALTEGIFRGPDADWDFRNKLMKEVEKDGHQHLYKRLKEVDPETAKKIDQNDVRRIIRALEIYEKTGQPISELQTEWREPSFTHTMIGLTMERRLLYERINDRVEKMFEDGLVEETKRLMEMGIEKNRTAMQAIGYKEVVGYLKNQYSLDEAKDLVKRNTRRYAKRQLTWFRKDDRIKWYDLSNADRRKYILKQILSCLC